MTTSVLLYDWTKIKKFSSGNVQLIKSIYQSMMGDPRPSKLRRTFDEIDFSGDSFILNPEKLMWAFHNANQKDAANYLMLASRRNYAKYLITGDNTLPVKYINIPIATLEQNSLIEIVGTDIQFLMEK